MADKKGYGFQYWKDGDAAGSMAKSPVFSSRSEADEERGRMKAAGYMCSLTMTMKAEADGE